MKRFNFWRSLFFSAMAVMAFAACSDKDDDKGGSGEASITVNGKAQVALGLTAEAGAQSEEVSIVSSGAWTLTFEPAGTDWCTASAVAGKAGTATVKFTAAALPADVEERSVTAVVETSGTIFGVPYTKSAKISIRQSASGEVVETIYKETFGTTQVASNTEVDKYTAWNKTGEGAADVTYVGTNVTIRNSSPNNSTSYNGASGAPILFFGAAPATFTVQNITLTAEQTKLQLTFGGQQTIDYDNKNYTWSNKNLLVALSADGKVWSTIEYTTNDGDQNADAKNWVLATANFTLKAPVEKLYIRFKSPILSSNLRIDDITLQTGIGGAEVDLEAGDPVSTVKINEITAAGDYQVEGATVVATYAKGFIMQDATGAMLVFLDAAPEVAVGDVVSVKGAVAAYGGVLQFGKEATVEKTGTDEPAVATPVVITADNIEGYMTKPAVTFVKMTGTLVKSGNYYNVDFMFDSKYTGSISSPNDALNIDTYVGNIIDIEGWFVNNGNTNGTGTYFTVVATNIANNTAIPMLTFTSTLKVFAGNNPEPQTITFSTQNIPADEIIDFTLTGENADKFDVQKEGDNSVTITAVGNNDSDAAYTAMLVAKYNGAVLDEVEVRQSVITTGSGYKEITSAADLTAGDYYLGGYGTTNKTLQLFTGALKSSNGVTSAYKYENGQLSTTETTEAAIVTLEAVENGYKIKVNGKYLTATKASSGSLALVESSDAYWTFSDATGVIKQDIKAEFSGVSGAGMAISITAGSNVLRSWNVNGTSDANGVVFFKAN